MIIRNSFLPKANTLFYRSCSKIKYFVTPFCPPLCPLEGLDLLYSDLHHLGIIVTVTPNIRQVDSDEIKVVIKNLITADLVMIFTLLSCFAIVLLFIGWIPVNSLLMIVQNCYLSLFYSDTITL